MYCFFPSGSKEVEKCTATKDVRCQCKEGFTPKNPKQEDCICKKGSELDKRGKHKILPY